MGQGIVRGRLRARLLVGVAAAAIAAPVTNRALAQDAVKWSPYIELGGMGGNTHSFGDVDIFIPLWQDQTSLLFGDLRGTFSTEPTQEGNFGIGYRTQISPDWILGGYGYFDIQNSKNDNLYYQATLGVELLSVDWDFRLNGYIPFNPDGGTVDDKSTANIAITGNKIQLKSSTQEEKALYGFDGEVGWRIPVFPVDGDIDVRVFAGGYYFTNSDVDTIAGPRGRIEARLYDIDFLGLQSRLTAQGVVQWDQPRGTQGFGGLELRIPLGVVTGNPGPKLNPLDRRMVDRVQRDVDIVTELTAPKKTSEDVIVDELTVSTHTIVFADGAGGGSGAQGSPTDLQNAVNIAPGLNGGTGSNAIILADGGRGTIGVTNPLQLLGGQALIGGGSTVRLTGAKTGLHVNFNFPGTRPTLSGSTSTANLIQMQPGDQNEIFGLNLTGSFSNGIFGQDMYRAIIKHTAISGAGANGILLVDDPAPREYVHIAYNTISNAAENGIEIDTIFGGVKTLDVAAATTAGGTDFSQTIRINDNTITSAGRNGIVLYDIGIDGSLRQSFAILDNTIDHVAGDGILVATSLEGATVFMDQSGTVAGNQITNVSAALFPAIRGGDIGAAAIAINNEIGGVPYGASLSQALVIAANTIVSAGANGVALTNYVLHGGTVAQTFAVDFNSIDEVGDNGIFVLNRVDPPSPTAPAALAQAGEIVGNQISNTGEDGILVDNFVSGASATFNQALVIDDNTVTEVPSNGIEVSSHLYNVLGASQALNINGNTIDDVGLNGIFVDAEVGAFPSPQGSLASFFQTFAIDNNVISHAGENGIFERLNFSDAGGGSVVVAQAGEINGNQVTSTGVNGIEVYTIGNSDFAPGTSLVQALNINDNTIADVNQLGLAPFYAGINVGTLLNGVLHATQSIVIDPNIITNVTSGNGINVFTSLFNSTLSQSLEIADNTISGFKNFGIGVTNIVDGSGDDGVPTSLSQVFNITGNQVTGGSFGIAVFNDVTTEQVMNFVPVQVVTAGAASLTQNGVIGGNAVEGASSVGIKVATYASGSSATFTQNVSAISNSVADTGSFGVQALALVQDTIGGSGVGSGIAFYTKLDYGARGTQNLLIAGNTVANSGSNGILVSNRVITTVDFGDVTTELTQTASITGNQVTNSGSFGIHVDNYVSAAEFRDPHASATLVQSLAIAGNAVAGSGVDGVLVSNGVFAHGEYGSVFLVQTASIFGNNISDSGENGIAVDTDVQAQRYATATLSQSIAINDNTVSGSGVDGIFVSSFASGYYRAPFINSRSGFVSFTQKITIDPNTVIGSGVDGIAVITDIRDMDLASQTIAIADNSIVGSSENGIHVETNVFADGEGGNTFLSQLAAIDGNRISDSGENGILVDNDVEARYFRSATLSQHLTITDNTVADSVSNGIFVSNFASGYNPGSHGFALVTQTGAIVGNQLTNSVISSGLNGIFLSNHIRSAYGAFTTIAQSLTIALNTIDGVGSANVTAATGSTPITRDGGNAILVRNNVGDYGILNQSLGISSNVATNVRSFDGVYIKTTAYHGATANQSFTIVGNHAFDNGGYGVAIKAIVKGDTVSSTGGTISQALTITGNTLDNNLYGALGVFALASQGRIVQTGTIANNILTNSTAHYGEGIDAAALAGSEGTVTQTIAANNNTIGGNAVGVYLAAGDRVLASDFQTLTGGLVSQAWSFTGNTITGNNANFVSGGNSKGGNGLYARVSGSNATQLITLVSGNLISGHSNDGVRLIEVGAQQTATLNSNLGTGAPVNTITANTHNLVYIPTGGTQVVHK